MIIALAKQDVYQDLYVCPNRSSPADILASSIMRVGPLGLFTLLDADFLIVREGRQRECKAYLKSYSPPAEVLRQLKSEPISRIRGSVFDYLSPRTDGSHADFSVDASAVDWGAYDVVISVNVAIPSAIVAGFPRTLWCYMMGEASRQTPYVEYGYDVRLTQEVTGCVAEGLGPVDFSYTFLGPDCLERLAGEYDPAPPEKRGVYAEINTTSERPVRRVERLEFVRELGHDVVVHDQDIVKNVVKLRNSKYFVKLGGRRIRGNSVIEAISAGTLALLNPKDVVHAQLLPKETWVRSEEEVADAIRRLDADDGLYRSLLAEQRKRVTSFVVDAPLESLRNCLEAKRSGRPPARRDMRTLLREIRRNYF
jgi:hypothetical protein